MTDIATADNDVPSTDLNRRQFVAAAAAAACLCLFCDGSSLLADDTPAAAAPVDVGPKSDYAADGYKTDWIKTNHFVVIRENSQLYACTSHCTHRNVDVQVQDNILFCAKHGSKFDSSGKVLQGPAKRSLVRYGISLDANSHVLVDKSKKFEEKDWTDPASFIPLT
jgi:nitrite reductase/ring-hydroxylating ferredoxin subunit